MLKLLTTVSTEIEVDLLLARLREAGIQCIRGPKSARSGGRGILVEEEDLDRAREVLKAHEGGFDEDELARLSEEAGREATEQPSSPQPAQADDQGEPHAPGVSHVLAKEHGVRGAFERLAAGKHDTNAPDSPFGR